MSHLYCLFFKHGGRVVEEQTIREFLISLILLEEWTFSLNHVCRVAVGRDQMVLAKYYYPYFISLNGPFRRDEKVKYFKSLPVLGTSLEIFIFLNFTFP